MHALKMREYRARLKLEKHALIQAAAGRPIQMVPDAAAAPAGEVEVAVRAELELLPARADMPGLAALAVNLAKLLDTPGYGSAGVAAQLRAALSEIRVAGKTASGVNRLAGLRSGVGSLKSGAA